jgi:hypothetical protein
LIQDKQRVNNQNAPDYTPLFSRIYTVSGVYFTLGSSGEKMSTIEFEKAVAEFVGAFEVVFRYDWDYTKIMFGDEVEGATFIEPGIKDESEDWGARGALLEKYRTLMAVMKAQGMEPKFPFPLENLPEIKQRVW